MLKHTMKKRLTLIAAMSMMLGAYQIASADMISTMVSTHSLSTPPAQPMYRAHVNQAPATVHHASTNKHKYKTFTKATLSESPMIAPQSKNVAVANHDQYRYFFVNLESGAYYLNNHVFDVGTRGTTTAALGKITDNGWTPIYQLGLGYHFIDCDKNLWASIFGYENAVLVQASYLNTNETRNKASLGQGTIWLIDGSGALWGGHPPIMKDLYDFKLKAKHRLINSGVYVKGHHYTTNVKLTMDPFIGLVYGNLYERYNYTLNYNTSGKDVSPQVDREIYKVMAHYYGMAAGNQLNYLFSQKLTGFAKVELQLLGEHARLNARQSASDAAIDQLKVRDTESKLTYRGILTVGLRYKLFNKPNSPSIALQGGIDRWGYSPKVVVPNSEKSSAVHLKGQARDNTFATLSVQIPLG